MENIVIGIGDLHGHYPALDALMKSLHGQYDIFSDSSSLRLKDNVELVFTGDYIDRGHSNIRLLETQMKMRENNSDNLVQLFGNHELLALGGLGRAKQILEEGGDESLMRYCYYTIHGMNGGLELIKEFGKFGEPEETAMKNYVERFSRGGDIGGWIRSLRSLYTTDIAGKKLLFVHGGIPKEFLESTNIEKYMDEFESHIRSDSQQFSSASQKYIHHPMVGEQSVFWDRGFRHMEESEVDSTLKHLGMDYIVIGHTPNMKITTHYGKVFDIDVGMTPKYGTNEPAAIVFKNDGIFEFYDRKGERKVVDF